MIIQGDCIEVLKTLEPESVDAVATDPPYGLSDHKPGEVEKCLAAWLEGEPYSPKGQGFMGKDWDAWVPGPEAWREVYRVLKPGAFIACFASTRTADLMSMALRLAGFRKHTDLLWAFGSGFPKATDLSKQIDKRDASEDQQARRYRFTEWVRSTGATSAQIDAATGTNMGGHYTTSASQPAIMTREHLEACRHLFLDVPEWVEREADIRSIESKNFADRELLGIDRRHNEPSGIVAAGRNERVLIDRKITAPATEAAKEWDGYAYGLQALKPAVEPILLFQKPYEGKAVYSIIKHGCGALNIDGSRIGTDAGWSYPNGPGGVYSKDYQKNSSVAKNWNNFSTKQDNVPSKSVAGRWPSNLILQKDCPEVMACFPEIHSAGNKNDTICTKTKDQIYSGGWKTKATNPNYHNDQGSAARFFKQVEITDEDRRIFYTAKPSKAERGENNTHVTVKPISLMKYLINLISRPGHTCLDPFAGSGTTGVACIELNRKYILIEKEPEYVKIIKARISKASEQRRLF